MRGGKTGAHTTLHTRGTNFQKGKLARPRRCGKRLCVVALHHFHVVASAAVAHVGQADSALRSAGGDASQRGLHQGVGRLWTNSIGKRERDSERQRRDTAPVKNNDLFPF